jgi:hypothetical protein
MTTVTTRHITGGTYNPENGEVTGGTEDIVIQEKRHAPDWRATAHIVKYRFPGEMGDSSPEPEPESNASGVTPEQLWRRIVAVAEERQEAGVLAEPIEVEAVEVETLAIEGGDG